MRKRKQKEDIDKEIEWRYGYMNKEKQKEDIC
jgi:hypothetical protein